MVVFEGDAKICFNPLSQLDLTLSWTLNTIISKIRSLSSSFEFCVFSWVKRNCNSAEHETTKFALNFTYPSAFLMEISPPPSFLRPFIREIPLLVLLLSHNEIADYQKIWDNTNWCRGTLTNPNPKCI